MPEQLIDLVKGAGKETVVENSEVPNKYNNEVMTEATNTVAGELRNVMAGVRNNTGNQSGGGGWLPDMIKGFMK